MKKLITILFSTILFISCCVPFYAMAETVETPALTSIEFNNATIEQDFNPGVFEYTIKLDDPSVTPTLKSKEISGSAEVFVNYSFDDAKHQTGVSVTLQYANGSVIYKFNYSNAEFSNSANNLLSSVTCDFGEVYPAINDKDTSYKLYIASDLTNITLHAVTQETSAYAAVPGTYKINTEQDIPSVNITVTAGNGTTRVYKFKIKRIKKTCDEVKAEMEGPNYKSIVDDVLFYKQPEFVVIIFSSIGGLILLIILILIAKRITLKVGDSDEKDFFAEPFDEAEGKKE